MAVVFNKMAIPQQLHLHLKPRNKFAVLQRISDVV